MSSNEEILKSLFVKYIRIRKNDSNRWSLGKFFIIINEKNVLYNNPFENNVLWSEGWGEDGWITRDIYGWNDRNPGNLINCDDITKVFSDFGIPYIISFEGPS